MGAGVVIVGGLWEISTAASEERLESSSESVSTEVVFTNSDRSELYDLVNRYRLDSDLKPLSINYKLERAAQIKSEDMRMKGYWSHIAPDGTTPWMIAESQDYQYIVLGENLARDFQSSQSLLEGWKNSQGHNENLIKKEYTESGIGYTCYVEPYQGCIVVMFYGTPSN